MRHLSPPMVDDAQILDSIIAAKREPRRTVLKAIQPQVIGAYAQYVAEAPAVENLAKIDFTEPQISALIHAYAVATAPMVRLRATLMEPVIVFRCPFCGIGEASTLDHYLPKEENPQFAVLSKNLVPCCSVCNTRKSDMLLDKATSVRCFLHPYYDEVPDARFVVVDIVLHPAAIGLVFNVTRPTTMAEPTFEHLKSHFRRLRLADRYRIMSLEHLRDRRRALARFYGPEKDGQRVARELMTDANDYEQEHGPNHWRAVLYRTLAGNASFCDGGFTVLNCIQ